MKKINNFILIAFISVIGINTASAQCTASFTSTDNGAGNFSFASTSTSPGASLYYVWEFGDGNYGSTQNPNHTYTASGAYTVCLTINDTIFGGTCISTHCDSVIVTGVGTPCNIIAGFTSVDNGNGNYSFTNTSTGNYDSYFWNFGDGTTSSLWNINNHTYSANGTFVVELVMYDSNNTTCIDYFIQTIQVNGISSPVVCNSAFVIYPDSSGNGDVIVFNTSSGTNSTYFWNFGDGNTSSSQYPNYTYTTSGPFNLCLTIADSSSLGHCTSTYCDSVSNGGRVFKQGGFNLNIQAPIVTGIENEIETVSELKVYPNPVRNNLTLEFTLIESSSVEVILTDLLGNKVAIVAAENMNLGSNKVNYNVSDISNGIYLLNIKTDNSLQVKKIVVNKYDFFYK
ncbi:MAG: PKD domain-containing protein [Flavobacteriales bacterium]|nr:PKD domain-containing protein [Flavobacteriales bacterium]